MGDLLIRADVTDMIALGTDGWVWSPDGRRLATEHAGEIWIFDVESTQHHSIGAGEQPIWSPDSERILVHDLSIIEIASAERYHPPYQGIAGGEPRFLELGSRNILYDVGSTEIHCCQSPDDSQVAYVTYGTQDEVHVVSIAGGASTSLGAGTKYSWSPGGRMLAIETAPGGIDLVPVDAPKNRVPLTVGQRPGWSPRPLAETP